MYAYVCMYVCMHVYFQFKKYVCMYGAGGEESKDARGQLLASILRFPSMLAAPPERLLG